MAIKPHKIVCGGTGSGKTTFMRNKFIPSGLKAVGRVAVFDSEDEYNDIAEFRANTIKELKKAIAAGKRFVTYEPSTPPKSEARGRELDAFLAVCDSFKPIIAVIEEAHENMRTHHMVRLSEKLYTGVKKGRKYGLNLVFVSQEPNDIVKPFWNNVGEVIAFRTKDSLDHWSFDGCDPREIPKYHYIRSKDNVFAEDRLCKPVSI